MIFEVRNSHATDAQISGIRIRLKSGKKRPFPPHGGLVHKNNCRLWIKRWPLRADANEAQPITGVRETLMGNLLGLACLSLRSLLALQIVHGMFCIVNQRFISTSRTLMSWSQITFMGCGSI